MENNVMSLTVLFKVLSSSLLIFLLFFANGKKPLSLPTRRTLGKSMNDTKLKIKIEFKVLAIFLVSNTRTKKNQWYRKREQWKNNYCTFAVSCHTLSYTLSNTFLSHSFQNNAKSKGSFFSFKNKLQFIHLFLHLLVCLQFWLTRNVFSFISFHQKRGKNF